MKLLYQDEVDAVQSMSWQEKDVISKPESELLKELEHFNDSTFKTTFVQKNTYYLLVP